MGELSVCSGAFLLGEAGLLDGRACTTHWRHTAELKERFPKASVDPDVLFVEDDRVITSAGTAAGIDACLHHVRCGLGACVLVAGVIAAGGATAVGAGSGTIFAGALTGGRSGPDPPASAGALPTPRAAIAAATSSLTNDGRVAPPASRSRSRIMVMSITPGRADL